MPPSVKMASTEEMFPAFVGCFFHHFCKDSDDDKSLLVDKLSAGNMDPYAVIKCRSQEQRSSIASGGYALRFVPFPYH